MKRDSNSLERVLDASTNDYEHFDSDQFASETEEIESGIVGQVDRKSHRVKKRKSKHHNVISPHELNDLINVEEAFQSNLFKMQMDALLNAVSIDYSSHESLQQALWKIKEVFELVHEQPEAELTAISKHLESYGITIPFPVTPRAVKYTFEFKKPASVRVVGSYMTKTVLKSRNMNVDLVVEMPASLLQTKDHLNNRYWNKRAYYLAMLALALKQNDSTKTYRLQFGQLNNDPRLSVLLIDGILDHFTLRILVGVDPSAFSPSRLAPLRNSIRSEATGNQVPTPHYNSAVLMTTQFTPNLAFMHEALQSCPQLSKAILLVKAFLKKRTVSYGVGMEEGRITGHVISSLMAGLLKSGGRTGEPVLSSNWNAYQLFRVTLEWIARTESHVHFTAGKAADVEGFDADSWKQAFGNDMVIVDPSGLVNMTSGVTRSEWTWFRGECRRASQMLSETVRDHFDSIFMVEPRQMAQRFDLLCFVDGSGDSALSLSDVEQLDFGSRSFAMSSKAVQVMTAALNTRVKYMVARSMSVSTCELDAAWDLTPRFVLGFMLDSEQSCRVIDFGCQADDEEATRKFKALWGSKAEVRRFKDGSILNCVVWDVSDKAGLDERSLIIQRCISHLMSHHFSQSEQMVQFIGHQLLPLLKVVPEVAQSNRMFSQPNHSFQPTMSAFDAFSRILRDLEDFPLNLVEIKPACASLRYASAFIPQPLPVDVYKQYNAEVMPFIEPMEVVLQFESSNRWPEDLAAIQNMKAAFYIHLADALESAGVGVCCTVYQGHPSELDPHGITELAGGYLDVTVREGYTFRCRLHHAHELTLIKRQRMNPRLTAQEKQVLQRALDLYLFHFVFRPYHTQRIQSLVHTFPVLSPVMRMVKRWMASHWVLPGSTHQPSPQCVLAWNTGVPDEVIEWLCASVWMDSEKEVPSSVFCGFTRVLAQLAHFDYARHPLVIVADHEALTAPTIEQIQKAFEEERKMSSDSYSMYMSVLIHAEVDETGMVATMNQDVVDMFKQSFWTRSMPSRVWLNRIRALALGSLKHLDRVPEWIQQGSDVASQLRAVFTHAASDYDLVLELKPELCARYYQNMNASLSNLKLEEQFKNQKESSSRRIYAVEFDPVSMLLAELQAQFGEFAWFFHDRYGGDRIGIVFDPQFKLARPLKLNMTYPIKIEKGVKQSKKIYVSPNVDAAYEAILCLGNELILQ